MRNDDPEIQRWVLAWAARLLVAWQAALYVGLEFPPELGAAIGACAFMLVLELTAGMR